MTTRVRIAIMIALALFGAVDGAVIVLHERIAHFILNARDGCWPWSPADVEYHDGMTICPGQTAHGTVIIEFGLPEEGSDI
jgi:hypothetical protein